MDPRLIDDWQGKNPPHEVSDEDPDIDRNFLITLRANYNTIGKTVPIQSNHFSVTLNVTPETEVFKYHVAIERSPDGKYGGADAKATVEEDKDVQMSDAIKQEQGIPEKVFEVRPLRKSLVRMILNELIRQNEEKFGGVRVVHDGMSSIYAPEKLAWDEETFKNVNPDGPKLGQEGKGRPPPTFDVKIKLVEAIPFCTLSDYYSDPEVNVMPILQALDVAARHLGAQRYADYSFKKKSLALFS